MLFRSNAHAVARLCERRNALCGFRRAVAGIHTDVEEQAPRAIAVYRRARRILISYVLTVYHDI